MRTIKQINKLKLPTYVDYNIMVGQAGFEPTFYGDEPYELPLLYRPDELK